MSAVVSLPLPLSFSPPSSALPVESVAVPVRKRASLWAAIHLPALPLEALGESAASARPIAVIESESPRAPILVTSAGARRAGIEPGMGAAAAGLRSTALLLKRRDPAREAAVLERLAHWGERFTSTISPEPPAGLLLDVGASIRLFGGIEALRERMRSELDAQGCTATLAWAPTPRAALWLARSGADELPSGEDALPGRLGALPLAVLQLPKRAAGNFDRLGVHTLGQTFRLPRDGLARRFGPELLRDWDRALGHLPEPRAQWQVEPRFAAARELPAPLARFEQLGIFIDDLLAELVAALVRRDAGIDAMHLTFAHEGRPATCIELQLLAADRDAVRLKRLLHTRLESVVLPAPAVAIRLASGIFKTIATPAPVLIDGPASPAADLNELIETLYARLGHEAVFGLAPVGDPRPEHAWRRNPAAAKPTMEALPLRRRPFWLLTAAHPLCERDRVPWYGGRPLALLAGPERIEAGWWDGEDLGRDYYLARAGDGARLWIYREHRGARRWFLHGYFA